MLVYLQRVTLGKVLREEQLDEMLRRQMSELRRAFIARHYVNDSHPNDWMTKTRYLTFADGSVWFPNGWDANLTLVDALANGARGFFAIAAILAIGYAVYAFSEQDSSRWFALAFAVASIGVAALAMVWFARRTRAAVARMDLGTLLLPTHLVLLSHGGRLVFPRSAIIRFEVIKVGTSQAEFVLHLVYAGENGRERAQPLAFGTDKSAQQLLNSWRRRHE